MKYLDQYKISFANLNDGEHLFDYYLDRHFFNNFEKTVIQDCKLILKVELIKKSDFLTFTINYSGSVHIICDRCGDYFDFLIEDSHVFYIKQGYPMNKKEENDVLYIAENERVIDISQYIYESIHLSLPCMRVHPDKKDCNQHVLGYIDKLETNEQAQHDPRWNKLKNITFNN